MLTHKTCQQVPLASFLTSGQSPWYKGECQWSKKLCEIKTDHHILMHPFELQIGDVLNSFPLRWGGWGWRWWAEFLEIIKSNGTLKSTQIISVPKVLNMIHTLTHKTCQQVPLASFLTSGQSPWYKGECQWSKKLCEIKTDHHILMHPFELQIGDVLNSFPLRCLPHPTAEYAINWMYARSLWGTKRRGALLFPFPDQI